MVRCSARSPGVRPRYSYKPKILHDDREGLPVVVCCRLSPTRPDILTYDSSLDW